MTRPRGAGFADVVRLAASLPEVEESTFYGTPALKVRGRTFCRMWGEREHRRDGVSDSDVLVVFCDPAWKQTLIENSGGVLFSTPHYDGYPAMLIRLADVTDEDLADLLAQSYLRRAPAELRRQIEHRTAGHDPGTTSEEGPKMSTTSVVTGVDFVSIPTRDLSVAMDFYEHTLGLRRSSVWQRPGQEPVGAEYETGTVTLALMACERLGIEFQPHKVPIALRVDDVAAAREALERLGVRFRGDTIDSGVCLQAIFEDPDGNLLDLHHRYAPRP